MASGTALDLDWPEAIWNHQEIFEFVHEWIFSNFTTQELILLATVHQQAC